MKEEKKSLAVDEQQMSRSSTSSDTADLPPSPQSSTVETRRICRVQDPTSRVSCCEWHHRGVPLAHVTRQPSRVTMSYRYLLSRTPIKIRPINPRK
jgi:hypothetical protein